METKKELEQKLYNLQVNLTSSSSNEERLHREARELNQRISELRGQFISVVSQQQKDEKAAKLKLMEDEYDKLIDEASDYQKEQKRLRPEIEELKRKILLAPEPPLDFNGTTPEQLLELEDAISAVSSECGLLQGKLNEMAKPKPGTAQGRLEYLKGQRVTLAASVSLGEADKSELADLNLEILTAEQAVQEEAAETANRAYIEQGLKARLETAKGRLEAAKQAHKAASVDFLRGAYNAAALVYLDAATTIMADYHSFAAIANRLNSLGDNTPIHPLSLPWLLQNDATEGRFVFDKRHSYASQNDRKGIQDAYDLLNQWLEQSHVKL